MELPPPKLVRRVQIALFGAITLEFFHRQLLAIAVEPLRADLGASDTQIGSLLAGFAVVYSVLALPLGRLADRTSRRAIYAGGIGLWSAATALGGMVAGFPAFLASRLAVGAGQATAGACMTPLVADYVRPERRGTSIALISMGGTVGSFIAFGLGGPAIAAFGWRATFMASGAIGLGFALLFLAVVREPARGWSEGGASADDGDTPSMGEVLGTLWRSKAFRHLAIGGTIASAAVMAAAQWSPAFFQRVHGLSIQQTGLAVAGISVIGTLGVVAGGVLGDRLGTRHPSAPLAVPAVATLASAPILVATFLVESTALALVLANLGITLALVYSAPIGSVTQVLAPLRMRAVAASVLAALLTLIGFGLGALATGALSDALAPSYGEKSLGGALAVASALHAWAGLHFALGARVLGEAGTRSA
jgi:predicted MFS family arabinose efflux permease